MKRQRYFPSTVAARPGWFNQFATELAIANNTLDLPAAAVTAIIADAKFCAYACGTWLTAVRDHGPAATQGIEDLFDGSSAEPFVLPGFAPAPPPVGVTAVTAGALTRIFDFVKTIKASPHYTENMGLNLGIVGQEDAADNPVPEFTLKVERSGPVTCECVKVSFKKFGRQGVVIYSRRGGGAWEMLAIDLASPYLDARPLLVAGTPELREYRLQYYDDAAPIGGFTEIIGITVSP